MWQGVADSRGCPFYVCKDEAAAGRSEGLEDFDEENSRLAETALRLLSQTNPALAVDEVGAHGVSMPEALFITGGGLAAKKTSIPGTWFTSNKTAGLRKPRRVKLLSPMGVVLAVDELSRQRRFPCKKVGLRLTRKKQMRESL